MRIRYNKNANEELANEKRYIEDITLIQEILSKEENKGKKIYLEIGMGKGEFITKLAMQDKDNICTCVYFNIKII